MKRQPLIGEYLVLGHSAVALSLNQDDLSNGTLFQIFNGASATIVAISHLGTLLQ